VNLTDAINWALGRRVMEQAGREVGRKAAEYMLRQYQARAPVDTGFMVNSAEVVDTPAGLQFHVVVEAPYAAYVEFGHLTPAGSWVPPNPALTLAMADTAAAFPAIASTVRLRRPESAGNESEGVVGSDVQYLGVSFDK
jgi:hypothetical protein